MHKIILLSFIIVLTISCEKSKKTNIPEATQHDFADTINLLTEEEKRDGWNLLFNGKDLEGWRFYKNKENNSWEVLDGTLHSKPFDSAEVRSDIMTAEQYKNFELVFDWKLSPQGNSGVMFRVTEEYEEPYLSGPEYQILDDKGYPGDGLKITQQTGSNYDMHAAPADKNMNPVGEWNTSKIIVNRKHVEHWLNNTKLLEYEIGSEDWNKRKEASKWKDAKGYGIAETGHIAFQDHKNEVWFRNIKLRLL